MMANINRFSNLHRHKHTPTQNNSQDKTKIQIDLFNDKLYYNLMKWGMKFDEMGDEWKNEE